jgi:hypothetical protein
MIIAEPDGWHINHEACRRVSKMREDDLIASVQYGDFKGTSAADLLAPFGLEAIATANGIDTDRQFVVAVRLYITENPAERPLEPSISLYAVDTNETGHSIDSIQRYLVNHDNRLPCQTLSFRVPVETFLRCFKRLSVVLKHRGLPDGVVYEIDERD